MGAASGNNGGSEAEIALPGLHREDSQSYNQDQR